MANRNFIQTVLRPLYISEIILGISRFKPPFFKYIFIWKYLLLTPLLTFSTFLYIRDFISTDRFMYGIVLDISSRINVFCTLLVLLGMTFEFAPPENHIRQLFDKLQKFQDQLENLLTKYEHVRKSTLHKVFGAFISTAVVGHTMGLLCLIFFPSFEMFSKMIFELFVMLAFNEFVTFILILDTYVREIKIHIHKLKQTKCKNFHNILKIFDNLYELIEAGNTVYGRALITIFFMIFTSYINITFTNFVLVGYWKQGLITKGTAIAEIFISMLINFYFDSKLIKFS